MTDEVVNTGCCVVGGGPAGMMLGYLLGRRGIDVTVLEKHRDFFRDFRGDTVHPSTLEVLYELGLLDAFLKIPHQRVTSAGGVYGDFRFQAADFSHVPGHSKFVALMPQWDFLSFLSGQAKKFPSFRLLMEHEGIDVVRGQDRITGVIARGPEGRAVTIKSDLVVGCDGRHSTMRSAAALPLAEFGVPIDVLWFRISRTPGDPDAVLGTVNFGKALILINRSDYFQAGMIIRKDSFPEIKKRGLDAFRDSISQLAPYLADRVSEVQDWDQVKLLTVKINRLRRWHTPGLLAIGDAAHAMSPAGGVGINLAIQDAVAAANLLADPLERGDVNGRVLASVQKRREFPTRFIQGLQLNVHNAFARVFENTGPLQAPLAMRVITRTPGVHRLLGYVVGVGIRREHVRDLQTGRPRSAARIAVGVAVGVAVAIAVMRTFQRPRGTPRSPVGA